MNRQPLPQVSHCRTPVRFTLIELLVAISVIAVLAALLMPALSKARARVHVATCLNNQKQSYLALSMYGGDHTEYPTNYTGDMPTSHNWGDECAGRWVGNAPSQVSWAHATPPYSTPRQGIGAIYHLLDNGYSERSNLACSISFKGMPRHNKGGWYFSGRPWDNYQTGVYMYNGPHTAGRALANNGNMTGLTLMSRGVGGGTTINIQRGLDWGISYKRDVVTRYARPHLGIQGSYSVDQIPFLTCPSIYNDSLGLYRETHHYGSSLAMPYKVQFDYRDRGWLARNYLFGDGHAAYVYAPSRAGYQPD